MFTAGRDLDGDSRGYRSAEEQARELTRSIRREVNKLSEQWNALIERSDAWKRKLDDTATVSILLSYASFSIFLGKFLRLMTNFYMLCVDGKKNEIFLKYTGIKY